MNTHEEGEREIEALRASINFRLWGSSRCRQMGVPLSDGGEDI